MENQSGMAEQPNGNRPGPAAANGAPAGQAVGIPKPLEPAAAAMFGSFPQNPAVGQGQQRRKRLACRNCRQAKLKCEFPDGVSNSCARCRRFGRICQTDSSFKREQHRRIRVSELVDEVQQLRSVVESTKASSLPPQSPATQHPSSASIQPERLPQRMGSDPRHIPPITSPFDTNSNSSRGYSHPREASIHGIGFLLESSPPTEYTSFASFPRTLEHISLSAVQITDLFKIFFHTYHPHLEMFDISISPDTYFDRSPLLFWAIISIAARRYEADPTLITSICGPCTKLLWSTLSALPHNRYIIQGIILICMWPFPVNSMWQDPSYMLITTVKAAAMQIGIHRPENVQDFLRKKTKLSAQEFQEAIKTWAGCYIAAQFIVVWIGQAPVFTSDPTIDSICSSYGVSGNGYVMPENFKQQLLISQFSNRVTQVMAENQSTSENSSKGNNDVLMNLLERDLEDLERRIGSRVTEINRINLSIVSLQLRVSYFFDNFSPSIRRRGLLAAYSTSLNFVQLTSSMSNLIPPMNSHQSPHGSPRPSRILNHILHTSPHINMTIAVAALVLLKALHSRYAQYVTFAEGQAAFNTALSLLRRTSLEDNDLPGRTSKILGQLWGLYAGRMKAVKEGGVGAEGEGYGELTLGLKTRGSGSLLHEQLWLWRKTFNRNESGFGESAPEDTQASSAQVQQQTRVSAMPSPATNFGAEGNTKMSNGVSDDANMKDLDLDLGNFASVWDGSFPTLMGIDLDDFNFDSTAFQ